MWVLSLSHCTYRQRILWRTTARESIRKLPCKIIKKRTPHQHSLALPCIWKSEINGISSTEVFAFFATDASFHFASLSGISHDNFPRTGLKRVWGAWGIGMHDDYIVSLFTKVFHLINLPLLLAFIYRPCFSWPIYGPNLPDMIISPRSVVQ